MDRKFACGIAATRRIGGEFFLRIDLEDMKKDVLTEIEINASAERVWQILSDFESFPDWNPFVTKVAGKPKVNEILKIEVQLPESRRLKFEPIVLKAEPNKELRWVGVLPLNSFRGEHFYQIEASAENKIRFIHGEDFSGWLVRLIWVLDGKKIEKGYRIMNEALKKRAESEA
jgi:hypothetical protein